MVELPRYRNPCPSCCSLGQFHAYDLYYCVQFDSAPRLVAVQGHIKSSMPMSYHFARSSLFYISLYNRDPDYFYGPMSCPEEEIIHELHWRALKEGYVNKNLFEMLNP